MLFLHALGVLAALAGAAWADDGTTDAPKPTAKPTSTSKAPKTIVVKVAASAHAFDPAETKAEVGDIIRFKFYPTTHGVARAPFGWPCLPYEMSDTDKPGFYSGLKTTNVVSNDPEYFDLRVNDTEPIFYYCPAPGSCVDFKMIGVINPNSTFTLAAQKKAAENATIQVAPGDPYPAEGPVPHPSSSGSPGSSGSSGSGSSGNSNGNNNNNDGGGSHLSGGAIAGIVIGAAAVLILGAALVYLCGRRGGFDKAYRKSVPPPAATAATVADPAASLMMVEAQYGNGNGAGAGLGVGGLKSPGQATMASSTFGGHDNATLRGSVIGGHYPGYSPHLTTPSPGPQTAGGYGHEWASPQPTPMPGYAPYVAPPQPAPVELPSGDIPLPTQSPPPGYHGRNSWVPGQGGHQP
ncbi:hypothetical protein C8A05DRAFT_29443 [Staphylotrichum tortipilum]|uniref:Extracellular serine-rich protein n=1 Tax=Staphylotrichum tortipilum TaxID=2831512 RepID=A0AAN6MT72_9PEZI|nr:hypothetical protein C8A05DRAFT_29443 [Staphylotrichum longicolle]